MPTPLRTVVRNGITRHYRGRHLHCDDGPAVICPDGTELYYRNGKRHRKDGPAEVYKSEAWWPLMPNIQTLYCPHSHGGRAPGAPSACTVWRQNGVEHRDDGGPSQEHIDGHKEWRQRGLLDNEHGPACVTRDGEKYYSRRGLRHREDGPAAELIDGSKLYYINDQLHKEDGPAVDCGDDNREWHIRHHMHRLDGPAHMMINRGRVLCRWFLWGRFYNGEEAWQAAIDRMARVKRWIVQRHRMRKTRRFVALCHSEEFARVFYAPEGMGGKWAHRELEGFEGMLESHEKLEGLDDLADSRSSKRQRIQ